MTVDISQFYQVFFEETAEHLANMESLLLGLDLNAASDDDLNAIFRCAHSIKGGAGTFGFTDIAQVTHVLETLLDRVRKHELDLTPPMVDAFLQAGDVIKGQLAAHRGEGEADPAAAAEVCATLNQLAGSEPAQAGASTEAAAASARQVFTIRFNSADRGVVENLLTELRGLGDLDVVSSPKARKGRSTKPAEWVLKLVSTHPEASVRELVEFVAQNPTILTEIVSAPSGPDKVRKQSPSAAPEQGVAPAADKDAEADPGFGFFDDAPGLDAVAASGETDADPGYGFFAPLPAPEEPGPPVEAIAERPRENYGRRATDQPGTDGQVAGRRQNDKMVVSANAESSIRVSVEKVDQLINLVGELVITQSMLTQTASQVDPIIYEKLLNGLNQLDRNTRDLQESVMGIRMMPISFVFSRFPRVVRDVASKLGKQVELKTIGEGTELDKGVIEKIADPLTHLVRNSLDHGIEMPDVRVAAGKPAKGTVTLKAFHQGGSIIVEVSDDGRGLDRAKILQKAAERGLPSADSMTDQEVFKLIFAPGFSTAEVVTDVSGRGVGMDVVKRNIEGMGGSVEIDSRAGSGTRIAIKLPLTLAILDGMSVRVGGEIFIIPLGYISESLLPAPGAVRSVANRGNVIAVRGDYLPVLSLAEVFGMPRRSARYDDGILVILEAGDGKTAVLVDELVGQYQVVIKSLESNYRKVAGISGATIMGDGRVAMIVDATYIVGLSRSRTEKAA